MKLHQIADHIFEIETYTEIDYAFSEERQGKRFDLWKNYAGGGCTCVVKKTDDGQMLTGRNMDLTVSNKPAYIVRTKCPDSYETVGISYFYAAGPDYSDAVENGVPDYYAKLLPFMCCDVMNSEGLYIEINMRSGEFDENGVSKFGCSGTNPGSNHRVCSMNLCRYIGEKCATIDEALELLNSLDIYTPIDPDLPWNFTFMLAEKSGRFGLLEIACNKISWLEGQHAQANFYLTEEFREKENFCCGLGRYDVVMNGLAYVQTEDDMYDLISKVSYSQVYKDDPKFDVRSEYAGIEDDWTTDYVFSENEKDVVETRISNNIETVGSMTRQELQDACKYWESVFTVVGNCNKRSMKVRFFEDESRVLTLNV